MFLAFRTIRLLWPFLREMILGDKSLSEAVRHNFWRVLLIGLIMLSFLTNFLVVPRFLRLSYQYVELEKLNKRLVRERWPQADWADGAQRSASGPVHPSPVAKEPPEPPRPDSAQEEYRRTRELFDRLDAPARQGR